MEILLTPAREHELRERFTRGVDVLDRLYPQWWERIDLPSLNLFSCERCVLGQLFGEFQSAVQTLTEAMRADDELEDLVDEFPHEWRENLIAPTALGFDADDEMTGDWIEEDDRLLEAGRVSWDDHPVIGSQLEQYGVWWAELIRQRQEAAQ